jgi:hypothetical protein
MTRNLKALGLALLAAFALSAVAASAASAQDVFTTHNGEPAHLHGEQVGDSTDNVFGMKEHAAEVTCKEATFTSTGTVEDGAKEIVVHPTYPTFVKETEEEEHNCESSFGIATVDTTGCDFVLTGETHETLNTKGEDKDEKHATVSLECEPEKSIKITTPEVGCTLTMTPQTGLLGVTYTNEGTTPDEDVKVDVTVDKIKYHASFICQLGGLPSTGEDAYLTETVTVKGYQGANHDQPVGIEVS